jgi:single-strand DNA-binding protein
MYNKVILAGNLTRDIEIRYTQSGSAIGSTAIATSRKFKSATGEQKEEVLFVDLTFFGRTAEIANQYLRKGSKVLVDGRLKLDQWTAQDGSKRSKHSVTVENLQMLGSRDDAPQAGGGYGAPAGDYNAPANDTYSQPTQPAAAPAQPQSAPEPTPNIPEIDISEDEIPF